MHCNYWYVYFTFQLNLSRSVNAMASDAILGLCIAYVTVFDFYYSWSRSPGLSNDHDPTAGNIKTEDRSDLCF